MKIKSLIEKYKETLLYIIFGVMTTVISVSVFDFFTRTIKLDELISNIISFIIAVLFAFITNRNWVFKEGKKQPFLSSMLLFYSSRLITLLIEELILLVFVKLLSLNALFIKTASQAVVIILNYIISKFFIFKNKNRSSK
ncbi:MAG: GtrA family protein [Acutalibacteraceae bacterium]|nr:GtrA family protein [Acutalibacteraceae bacterium]